ncbi:MAG TPA: ribosome-binding factor A, partial [Firmicutes bacterium]|nr:ribosome-binding factor A [Bacillota bacterium]
HTPEIHFTADTSLEEGARILSLIDQIQKEGRENQP